MFKPGQQLDEFGCLICTAYNYLFSILVSSPPLRHFIEHLASSTARRRWSWSCRERTGSCREGIGSRSLYCSSALDPTALRPPVRNQSGSRPATRTGKGQGAGAARCRSVSLLEPVLLVAGPRCRSASLLVVGRPPASLPKPEPHANGGGCHVVVAVAGAAAALAPIPPESPIPAAESPPHGAP